MESNGVGTYIDGWGMSIATQRAKKCKNRTPDVEVMGKTVKLGMLKLAWAVVPLGWAVVPLVSGFFDCFGLEQGLAVVPFVGR